MTENCKNEPSFLVRNQKLGNPGNHADLQGENQIVDGMGLENLRSMSLLLMNGENYQTTTVVLLIFCDRLDQCNERLQDKLTI